MTIDVTAVNDPPAVATEIPDQLAAVRETFEYVVPAGTFSDVDTGDTLTYAAEQSDGTVLPAWLSFTVASRTFSGTPGVGDVGTLTVKVTVKDRTDSTGLEASDEFDIEVRQAGITLSVDDDELDEGDSATTITVTAELDGATIDSDTEVTVSVGSGTAIEGTDFADVDGFTITISANTASGTGSFSLDPTDDRIDEEDETVLVSGVATGFRVQRVEITIADDDTRGVTVSPTLLNIDEGNTGSYTVVLDTQPTGAVTVTPSSSDTSAVTVPAGALTFTVSNWSTAQSVTVRAVQDSDVDHETVTITHGVSGADYASVTAAGVTVNVDDDETTASFLVSNIGQTPNTGIVVAHASQAQQFTTGSNAGGYALSDVQVYLDLDRGEVMGQDVARVRIWSADNAGNPDASLYVLTSPNPLADDALNTFTAPVGAVLQKETRYFVVVEATSGSFAIGDTTSDAEDMRGASGWSISGTRHLTNDLASWSTATNFKLRIAVRGSDAANNAPVFADDELTREVPENTTAVTDVGTAIPAATDADNDTLMYSMGGADAASFDFDAATRQIKTRSGVIYDHEAKASYSVTVTADDSRGGTDTLAVTIDIGDVDEPPAVPGAPTVSATSGSGTSLDVSWAAPANDGKPEITDYDVRYCAGAPAECTADSDFTAHDVTGTATSATIGSLTASTTYQVQVRATNAEGSSDWSSSGSGTTRLSTNAAPTSADGEVTTNEDTPRSFAATDFTFSDTDGGDALESVKITSLPASGRGELQLNGTAIASGDLPQAVTKAQLDGGNLRYVPPADANGDNYATFGFRVNDGDDDSTQSYTMTRTFGSISLL